jgi:hypothetical protein
LNFTTASWAAFRPTQACGLRAPAPIARCRPRLGVRPWRMPGKPQITDDTPLRLAVAAEMAFPGGGMTASSLRKEAEKGRVVIERVAGKDYTTLGAIAEMRRLYRLKAKPAATLAPALDEDRTDIALVRLRGFGAEEDAKLKAAAMTKRERDALEDCHNAKGTSLPPITFGGGLYVGSNSTASSRSGSRGTRNRLASRRPAKRSGGAWRSRARIPKTCKGELFCSTSPWYS